MILSVYWKNLIDQLLKSGNEISDPTGDYLELTMVPVDIEHFDYERLNDWVPESNVEEMKKVFLGGGESVFGHSYHDMIIGSGQFQQALDRLQSKRSSKKAVIVLGMIPGKEWVPCVNVIHFWVRGNDLCLNYYARGQDVWLKFIPDILALRELQRRFASELDPKLSLGPIKGVVASAHLYFHDREAASNMTSIHAKTND